MQINEFIDKLLATAKAEGIVTAEVYAVNRESTRIMARGDGKDFSSNLSQGLSFRAIINGKMGYAYTEALDDAAISQLIKGVKDSAALIEDEDEQFMFEGADEYPIVEYSINDTNPPSTKELISSIDGLETKLKAINSKISGLDYGLVSSNKATVKIVNTKGMNLESKDNAYVGYIATLAKHEGKAATGEEQIISRNFENINFYKISEKAVERAVEALDADSVASGLYNIVIDGETMSGLLAVYSAVFSAENAQKGMSLLAGKEGQEVANKAVKLIDNPLLKDGWGSTPFDSEGVPSQNKDVIANGKLQTLLHNLKTAKKAGVKSTGNASKGGYSAPISVGPSNLYFENGNISFDNMLINIGEGIVITELSAMHSGANTISGDFSLPAKGYTFKNGKKDKQVNQITVSSNFYTLLKQMECFANDLEFKSSIASPSVYVGKLSIAGK